MRFLFPGDILVYLALLALAYVWAGPAGIVAIVVLLLLSAVALS